MSPEQTQGEKLDQRSDIYSLGLIFYELLTGKLPFEARKPVEIMRAHVRDAPIPLSQRVPGFRFSPNLQRVLDRALAKRPKDRYPSAMDFAEGLHRCLAAAPSASTIRAMNVAHRVRQTAQASSSSGAGQRADTATSSAVE